MSYALALNESIWQQTGSQPAPEQNRLVEFRDWHELWGEIFRTQALQCMSQQSTPVPLSFAVATLPMCELPTISDTVTMLAAVERVFGTSATWLAKMLKVSRPMVYHYRDGMEPSVENKRRLQLLATLANDASAIGSDRIKRLLRARQPEGKTLLEFLAEDELDLPVLRKVLWRNAQAADRDARQRLSEVLMDRESEEARGDVTRMLQAQGKPTYIGDPDTPGKLIQIRPDGKRVRGRMVKRRFVPDE